MVTFSGKYIVRNKKKTSVIMFALAFGVLLMMLTNTIISSINDNVSAVWAEPLRHFSVVRQLSDQAEITPTDEMKPIVLEKIFITGVTGRISTHCFFTDTGTRDEICKLNHVTLTAGKMPETGTNQIAVSEEIAKNKKLKVGDIIGTSVDPTEGLIGSYEISGLFTSDGIFSLGDGSYYLKQMPGTRTDLLVPSGCAMPVTNGEYNTDYQVYSYESETEDINNYGEILNISMIVILMFVYIVILFLTIFVIYIFTAQRKREFGIMMAIGFRKSTVISRTLAELAVMQIFGLILGIAFGLATAVLLNECYFKGEGQALTILHPSYFLGPAGLTLLTMICSSCIICKIVSKVDCVAMIENES